jgi:CRP-like cAMP-binding protein
MDTPREIDIAELELFADCTKSELRKIRALTTYVRVPQDRVLMREGSRAHEFIIINSGTAVVSRKTDDGDATVAEVGSGEFLGEMALLTGTLRNATGYLSAPLTSSGRSFGSPPPWPTRSSRPPWSARRRWNWLTRSLPKKAAKPQGFS